MTVKELYALSKDIMRFTNEPISINDLSQEQIKEFEKLQTAARRSSIIKRFKTLLNNEIGDTF